MTDFIKHIPVGGFGDNWGPDWALIHSRTWEKTADLCHTPEGLMKVIADLKPRPEGVYVHLNALGASEAWGCFVAGTPVLMADGTEKAIEAVRVGDLVLTHQGRARRVENVQLRTDRPHKVRLQIEGLIDPVVTTPEHPFLAHRGAHSCSGDRHQRCLPPTQGRQAICRRPAADERGCATVELELTRTWTTAAELSVGDWATFTFPQTEADRRAAAEYRLLGLWLAEGSYRKRPRSSPRYGEVTGLEFSFGLHELTTLAAETHELARELSWPSKGYQNLKKSCARVDVQCGPERAARWRQEAGEYSYGTRVPADVFHASADARMAVVAGFIDGDGCFNIHGKENRCTTRIASLELARGMQRLIWSLGAPCSLMRFPTERRDYYQLSFPLSRLPRLAEFSTRYKFRRLLASTKARGFVHDGAVFLPIRGIEYFDDERPVFNLEIEEDHSYVAGGVTVHNCNRNRDAFPEWSLRGHSAPTEVRQIIEEWNKDPSRFRAEIPCSEYGLKTFVTGAKVYIQHANKDPLKSVGDVVAAEYNDYMRRGELIIFVYEARDPDGVRAMRNGDPVAFSMGAKLPMDACGVCLNLARHRGEYCSHMKDTPGRIDDHGRMHGTYNWFPRFFDISKVFVPADRSAWLLRKVASATSYAPPTVSAPGAALLKAAWYAKRGTWTKETPVETGGNLGSSPLDAKTVRLLRSLIEKDQTTAETVCDPQLEAVLREKDGLKHLLSALALAGIQVRPDELRELKNKSVEQEVPQHLAFGPQTSKLLTVIRVRMPTRSLLAPAFQSRIEQTKTAADVRGTAPAAFEPDEDYRRYQRLLRREMREIMKTASHSDVRVKLDPDWAGRAYFSTEQPRHDELAWLPFVVAVTTGKQAGG